MLEISAPDGIGEITPGEDLTAVLLQHARLLDGDVVVVTSKIVSKSEDRLRAGHRAASTLAETQRVVATRGSTSIVRSRLGITHAEAGIDSSNVPVGTHALLPQDPDASARTMRTGVWERAGVNVGILISDTAGRAWRIGQTEIAIGAAGVRLIDDYAGRQDSYGNQLAVTQTCLADEICAAAELVQGKLGRRPIATVRGLNDVVLAVDDHGSGASCLNRDPSEDLFGLGAREAVTRAILARDEDASGFGAPTPANEFIDLIGEVFDDVSARANSTQDVVTITADQESFGLLLALAFAHGWRAEVGRSDARLSRRIRLVRIVP